MINGVLSFVCLCTQCYSGNGDSWEYAGLRVGRESEALRPRQQGALQAVQTG